MGVWLLTKKYGDTYIFRGWRGCLHRYYCQVYLERKGKF